MARIKKPKMETPVVVPVAAEVGTFLAPHQSLVEVPDMLRTMKIETEGDYDSACAALREICTKHDAIDAKRLEWVEPLKKVSKSIDSTFRPVLKSLKDSEEILRGKIQGWVERKAIEAREAMRQAATGIRTGAPVEQVAQAIATAAAVEAERSSGVSNELYWTGEVVDASQIPREFLIPDLAKLEAVTAALGEATKIPGWSIQQKARLRVARKELTT